jgi:hypothetical protein
MVLKLPVAPVYRWTPTALGPWIPERHQETMPAFLKSVSLPAEEQLPRELPSLELMRKLPQEQEWVSPKLTELRQRYSPVTKLSWRRCRRMCCW